MKNALKKTFIAFIFMLNIIGCGGSKEDKNVLYRGCGNSGPEWKLRNPIIIVSLKSLTEETDFYEPAQIVGGLKSLQSAIIYPENANRGGYEGKVYIYTCIDTIGKITELRLLKGIGGGCDEAAIDGIKKQIFIPSKRKGMPINDSLGFDIIFMLQ